MSAERRASSRQRFRPLDFWANERVVYQPTLEGPVIAGVITQQGVETLHADVPAATSAGRVDRTRHVKKRASATRGASKAGSARRSRASGGSSQRGVSTTHESDEEKSTGDASDGDGSDGDGSDGAGANGDASDGDGSDGPTSKVAGSDGDDAIACAPLSEVGAHRSSSVQHASIGAEAEPHAGRESSCCCHEGSAPSTCRILACRRWGRSWQYHVFWEGSQEARWKNVDEVPVDAIDAFLHGNKSTTAPSQSAGSSIQIMLPPRKRKTVGAAGIDVD
ncbi:hypothetical protein AB1Y20_018762 [Prymnesium parvum]|uniref:Chromo domain-containing protein n=1 Tax=Prymnesium parvum TaxID=97485 RepID=A0AB34JR23_PRYPA